MEKFSLTALARQQLKLAVGTSSGRSSHTVYGGHEHVLRQTLITLADGHVLDEPGSSAEATIHVLHGRVRLVAAEVSWDAAAGDLLVVPATPHTVSATQDATLLLTVAQRG